STPAPALGRLLPRVRGTDPRPGDAVIRFEQVPEILGERLCGALPEDWPAGEIRSVEQDSRRIRPPGLFVAVRGTREDGRRYLEDAAANGARAVVGQPPPEGPLPYLMVDDARRSVAMLSVLQAGDPSARLELIGITGTNGKTTTSWLLQAIWEGCGVDAAVLGTLGSGRPGALRAASHTTPEPPRFQALLRDLSDEGYRAVAAEISSHGLDQERSYGTRYRAVVFTNLSRDHLDYHGTFGAYRDAKRKLFHPAGRGRPDPVVAVANSDDPATEAILEGSPDRRVTFGSDPAAEVRLRAMEASAQGIRMQIEVAGAVRAVVSPLIGAYNGRNLLAAYAAAFAVELPLDRVEQAIARGVHVPGRMERVDAGQPFLVIVDYAHTPDALERVLAALRPLTAGRLSVLFGCGGDRDPGKRSEMGEIAGRLADRITLTSDNPRSEDPGAILDAIRTGVRAGGREPDLVTPDREAAIFETIAAADAGDTVLVAGKGHETTQETVAGRTPFDDRRVATRALRSRGYGS
ncbi:MAG: UDP-N-acetylmuramoyl-L-alanyl-D-glutamate--2,6-diaminopimelate ligase, partial [Candidatus Latescibacteria bacterium]|nr:UDP-N-acetylmuramoyl-L-alanyl-D-glutamate--2,6-diaminopimelate ligase [Candidatus Latescibacterota bacterium]